MSERNPHGLRPGDTLWYVAQWRSGGSPRYVTVKKVGRKFAWMACGMRVYLQDLHVDAAPYASPGRCYTSKAAYEMEDLNCRNWAASRKA
jgi:hypothetical protein